MQLRTFVLAATALLALPQLALGMQYRDNQVWFFNGADDGAAEEFMSGSFNVTLAVIPQGQDPLHYHKDKHNRVHPLQNTKDRWNSYFSFLSGRHRSTEVARWWNTNITAGRCTFGHNAMALNFAFLGDLRLEIPIPHVNVTFKKIALAQGNVGVNNWWFGGEECGRVDNHLEPNTVLCPGWLDNGTGVSAYFRRGGGKPWAVSFGQIIQNIAHF